MKRFLLVLLALPAVVWADVRYSLTPDPRSSSVRVTLTIDSPREKEEFRIPAWCPGFYSIRSYQEKISDVRATSPDGTQLPFETTQDKRGWVVNTKGKDKVTLSYRVLGDDPGLGFFAVNVRAENTFVNGASAFMYVDGRLKEPCTLRVVLPEGWDIATGMDKNEAGVYVSGDYDEFIDHPIQLGKFTRKTFTVENIPFEAVYVTSTGTFNPNLDTLTEEIRKVSVPAVKLFGGAPFKRYVYIVHLAVGTFGGGLEHRASTVLAMPNSPDLRLAELAAHEFFHAWNVKQIRPRVLGPFDYTKKVRTGNLWFAEGVTDYYAHLLVYRSQDRDSDWLLEAMSDQIAELQIGETRKQISLEEACQRTWEDSGFGVGDLSYYTKGLVAGLILDAAIRSETHGTKSLDDVMRLMYAKYRLPNLGYEEDGILMAVNEVAGADMSELYRKIVRSTEEMPYWVLERMGLKLTGVSGGNGQIPVGPSIENGYRLVRNPKATVEARTLLEGWLKR